MQQERIENDVNMNLIQMISTRSIEDQCAKISEWLKKHYNLYMIGFFLKGPHTTRAHFFTETAPMKIVHSLEDMLLKLHQSEKTQNTVLLFALNEGEPTVFDDMEHSDTMNPTGITIPLHVPGHLTGTLALVADPKTIRYFTTESLENISFVSLISALLKNAYRHELNDKKYECSTCTKPSVHHWHTSVI